VPEVGNGFGRRAIARRTSWRARGGAHGAVEEGQGLELITEAFGLDPGLQLLSWRVSHRRERLHNLGKIGVSHDLYQFSDLI
jgi:hypothetical protein